MRKRIVVQPETFDNILSFQDLLKQMSKWDSEVSGLVSITFQEGSNVSKGQLLLKLTIEN
jgi:hypothetical protein